VPDVIFRGPGHRLVAFGKTVLRGQLAEFTDQEVRELLAHPRINIDVGRMRPDIEPDRPSVNASRRQWVGYAAQYGVVATDSMSREDIAAAVDARQENGGEPPEPEADTGEGHPETHEKEA
jgi:hypothetical protein